MTPFVEGLIAGYGIAIPVGAIGVLLIDLALRRGFRIASGAAIGVASADVVYATVAVAVGAAVAEFLAPYQNTLRIISALVLLGVAAYLLVGALGRRSRTAVEEEEAGPSWMRTYFRFLGLTILNPATITYFVALIVGLDMGGASAAAKLTFIVAVFLASGSWQLALVGTGAFLHERLPDNARGVLGVMGAAVVAGFALRLFLSG